MSKYRRKSPNLGASMKFLALVGVLAGAAMVQAQQPLSPWANVVDLAGTYMAPSPGAQSDGLARVNTLPSADNVTEVSNGIPAQENTFTPYSDQFKKPMPLQQDLRGHSVSADIDLGDPLKWKDASANMAFVVGAGSTFGSGNPDGVVVEARYYWPLPNEPHAQFRLRTSVATGNWIDAGAYGLKQVEGSYTVRIDVDASGLQAMMIVTPKPQLLPPPTDWYLDLTDTQAASITGPLPFEAGFWTSGQPYTARGAARLCRMVTNAGDMAMWLKSTSPFITSQLGLSQGATAPVTTEFHLGMSNLEDLSRGFQASGIYYGTVYGYQGSPMIMDPTALIDQSYENPAMGPFQYLKSPFIFTFPLFNELNYGPYGFANFRVAAAAAPGTPSLNTDAELAGLPVGPVNPSPIFGLSGGAIWVQLTANDPEGILGVTGCAYQNGQVYAADVYGSDTVIVDEVRPIAAIDGGYVRQGSTNLIPASGPNVVATQGNVDVVFRAQDLGDYMALTGSGLGDLPQAVIERLVGTDWVAFQPLTIYPRGDNMFGGTFTVDNQIPCGTYRVRLIAQDRVGLINSPTTTRAFDVKTLLSVTVNLTLGGLADNPNANNQRLIRFMLGSQQGTQVPPGGSSTPPTIIDRLVRFANGRATLTFSEPDIPHCDGNNLVVWVKDLQHTLGVATAPQNGIVGGNYTFDLTLRPGDVNNDNVVNFTDYALFIADYGKNAPRDMTSMTWYRNCDLNGSGQVDFVDWTLFYPQYGVVGDLQPGNFIRSFTAPQRNGDVDASAPGLMKMTVKQLTKLGVTNAALWDLNHDGWVDKGELDKALQAKMHAPKPGSK